MASSLLPPNATRLETALEAAAARIGAVPSPIAALWSADDCPAALLPYLAWALSVDDWDMAWPERIKRAVIQAAIAVHRRKGTIGAVHRALEAMDLDLIRVIEWFEQAPEGRPHTFDVEVGTLSRGLAPEEWAAIHAAIGKAKNLRSHLGSLKLYQQSEGRDCVAAACLAGSEITIYPWVPEDIALGPDPAPFVAAALHTWTVVTLKPGSP